MAIVIGYLSKLGAYGKVPSITAVYEPAIVRPGPLLLSQHCCCAGSVFGIFFMVSLQAMTVEKLAEINPLATDPESVKLFAPVLRTRLIAT